MSIKIAGFASKYKIKKKTLFLKEGIKSEPKNCRTVDLIAIMIKSDRKVKLPSNTGSKKCAVAHLSVGL